jgi:hypothetical protein
MQISDFTRFPQSLHSLEFREGHVQNMDALCHSLPHLTFLSCGRMDSNDSSWAKSLPKELKKLHLFQGGLGNDFLKYVPRGLTELWKPGIGIELTSQNIESFPVELKSTALTLGSDITLEQFASYMARCKIEEINIQSLNEEKAKLLSSSIQRLTIQSEDTSASTLQNLPTSLRHLTCQGLSSATLQIGLPSQLTYLRLRTRVDVLGLESVSSLPPSLTSLRLNLPLDSHLFNLVSPLPLKDLYLQHVILEELPPLNQHLSHEVLSKIPRTVRELILEDLGCKWAPESIRLLPPRLRQILATKVFDMEEMRKAGGQWAFLPASTYLASLR